MDWKLAYAHHAQAIKTPCCTAAELSAAGFPVLNASVPGCLETELMKAGLLEDLYYSTNTLQAQKLEDVHLWYFTKVQIDDPDQYLLFEGIDTFADIYVNGKLAASTENMFVPCQVQADWILGHNEIVVHIKPTMLEARKYSLPAISYALRYNYAGLYVRKPGHMFGWDIMPRIVSAGLWKPVTLHKKKADAIQEVYLLTQRIDDRPDGTKTAFLRCFIQAELSGVYASEYRVQVQGVCGDSSFCVEQRLWHTATKLFFEAKDCKLWWPKNAGQQNLYKVTVNLFRGDTLCDSHCFDWGIRTMELERTDITDDQGSGEFCFKVNGKKIFICGTNWVPLDALHCNDPERLPKALELLDHIGCNMVRCWGGNVYESDEFFDFCDQKGILVWQDFSMGCGIYPNEPEFAQKLEQEATCQIKRLRNHPALALWAGDNECDQEMRWANIDPNENYLTRSVLKRCVQLHDYARPYLPSSPYISTAAFKGNGLMPEDHLWGPRDYFKGQYYRDTFCHFASETGYHGFPSPKSLEQFLEQPEVLFQPDGTATPEYLVHAAGVELDPEAPYAYRIRLAYDQVLTLFGSAAPVFADFVRQSQISQAEAKKYFIEKFRIDKWKRTGIIWWNLLDGWPQVSDAVVDYYHCRKLAYHYIKRSQQPLCLMFDEPEQGKSRLMAVNDLPQAQELTYTVTRFSDGAQVLFGSCQVDGDCAVQIDMLPVTPEEKEFYHISWSAGEHSGTNHYFTNILDIDYSGYMQALESYKMDEFEGF